MYSGYMDKRVSVTKNQRVFDGRGGWKIQPVTIGEFFASVEPMGIAEIAQYSAMDISVTTRIFMRYHPDIGKDAVISFRDKRYIVQGIINPAYEDEYMELAVVESGTPTENTPALVTQVQTTNFEGKSKEDGDETRKIYLGVTYDEE